MKCDIVSIQTKEDTNAKLHTYFLDNYKEIDSDRTRPVVLICPGGGYEFTSDREAEAVAIRFLAIGCHACVLRYSVAPAEFPKALGELAWCVDFLRTHAREYGIDENKIIVAGFSAGGHLAASLGVFWNKEWLQKEIQQKGFSIRPNGLILSYPVISSGEYAHAGSFKNLMGKKSTPELEGMLSLETQVNKDVPPVFIWHTFTDQSVPVQNTILFTNALIKKNISVEQHIFPEGEHGLSLANDETAIKENGFGIQKRCQKWIELAGEWILDL